MSTLFKTFGKGNKDSDIIVFSSTAYIRELHHHAEYEFLYLKEGAATFQINNTKHEIKAGDFIFIEPNVDHRLNAASNNYLFYTMVFKPAAFGKENDNCRKILDQIKIKEFLNIPNNLTDEFIQISNKNKLKSFGLEIQTRSFLYKLMSHIIESNQYIQFSQALTNMDLHSQAVQAVCKFIQEHYSEKIDYEDILNLSNYSKSQFIKIFRKETGMNITDYLNRYRIEKACLDLLDSKKNITEIAISNGFNNIQYFSKKFKETMNCTPKDYKSNARIITGDGK